MKAGGSSVKFILSVFVIILLVVAKDYLTPAVLQVDLNEPRFRLVRHRKFFPDQEMQMEWKRVTDWTITPQESPPVFGQFARGGRYAWETPETGGMRFESLYAESFDHPVSDNWLRTNFLVFQFGTGRLPSAKRPLETADEWARSYQKK